MKPFRTQRPPGPQKAQIRCSGPVAGSGQLLFKCLLKMDHFARKGSQGHKGPRSVDRPCGWNRSVAINVFIKRWTISQTRATMGAQIRCSGHVAGIGQLLFKCLLKRDHFAHKGSQGHGSLDPLCRPCGWNQPFLFKIVYTKRSHFAHKGPQGHNGGPDPLTGQVAGIGQLLFKCLLRNGPLLSQRPPGPQKAQIRCSGHVAGSGQLLFK